MLCHFWTPYMYLNVENKLINRSLKPNTCTTLSAVVNYLKQEVTMMEIAFFSFSFLTSPDVVMNEHTLSPEVV